MKGGEGQYSHDRNLMEGTQNKEERWQTIRLGNWHSQGQTWGWGLVSGNAYFV